MLPLAYVADKRALSSISLAFKFTRDELDYTFMVFDWCGRRVDSVNQPKDDIIINIL